MKTKSIFGIFLLLALWGFTNPDWQLAKASDGIKVYIAESSGLKFKQFKVEANATASPKQIVDAVVDLEKNYTWFSGVSKGEMIKVINANEFIFKQVINVPFPFDNREVVQHCKISNLPNGAMRIDLKEQNDASPISKDLVRMPYSRGYWIVTPNGSVSQIEYSFKADPGGNIPAWLANQFIVDTPFKTIKGLRKYLTR